MEDKIQYYKTAPASYSYEKWHTYCRIISSFTTFDVPDDIQQLILEALHDEEYWDWYIDCNGANLVSEPGWKGRHSPAYIRHDYDWGKYGPSIAANNTMYLIQNAYGMDKWRSCLRWAGVTFFGYPVHKIGRWFSGK